MIDVPRPKFQVFRSEHVNPAQRIKPALGWLHGLPTWARDKITLYVYRDWPTLKIVDTEQTGEYSYIDKMVLGELMDESALLNRYGCGRYHVIVNDNKGALCTLYITDLGNDMKSFPPSDRRVSDIDQVDLSHPDNRSYVEFLRMKGVLPSQIDNIRKEGEMATAQVVDRVMEQNSKLTDQLLSSAKEQSKPAPAPVQAPGDAKALDVMADAAKRSNEIMQSTFTAAHGMLTDAKKELDSVGPKRSDEGEFERAIKLLGVIQQAGNSGAAEVAELRKMVATMQAEQVKSLADQVNRLIEAKSVAPSSAFGGVTEGLKALKEFKATYGELIGEPEDKNPVEEAAETIAPKFMRQWGPIIQMGMQLANNFFLARAASVQQPAAYQPQYAPYPQQPYPYPPQQATQPAPQAPQPMQFGNRGPNMPQPPQPASVGPQLVPTTSPYPSIELSQEVMQLLSEIAIPLFSHLNISLTGTDFADWFVRNRGEVEYQAVVEMTPEAILSALYTFPQTAGPLQRFPVPNIDAFVREFCDPQFGDDEEETGKEGADAKKPSI